MMSADYKELLEKGKYNLFHNDAHAAMDNLKEALELCPCDHRIEMGEILFFLGMAFKNLGHTEFARRCWENAVFVRDNYSLDAEENENWKSFHGIQVRRYLKTKSEPRFESLAEGDMIHDLIWMTWNEIKDLHEFKRLGAEERVAYFHTVRIEFPSLDQDIEFSVDSASPLGQIISFSRKP